MMYEDIVADLAARTSANLRAIREIRQNNREAPVYEVTQLINSMLGLLVFPQQRYVDRIPRTPLAELQEQGWPVPKVTGNHPQVEDLRDLVRMLRNAIAHFNLAFRPDAENEIKTLTVWNTNLKGTETWRAELSIADLDAITERFIELLLNRETYQ
ncbi:HEPN family nuclease [Variovorax sp. J22R115]|uniref:HEPN family nuclease n=1 Tax=Variovorax sp. J22R115 TaxID=3053509 RepID=UPI0025782F1A|nr:HEPN family nuclease [Variovorax sp. J22R115]MDM0051396.1 HEPN family nuclease [Variovorax sp. J22R115]